MTSRITQDISSYKVKYRTFTGCGPRWKNEDTTGVVTIPDRDDVLFILCDGMGGHGNGDVASRTVVKAFENFWRSNYKRMLCDKKIIDAAEEAMVALNKRQFLGMGTTMAMIAINNNRFFTAHCGDSRIYYCFRQDGEIPVITGHLKDHITTTPEGWPYVAKGFIQHESKHIPEIHEFKMRLTRNDRFLICSDGVYNAFRDNEIEVLMRSSICIDDLTDILHDRCKKAARDNFSAIIVEIE